MKNSITYKTNITKSLILISIFSLFFLNQALIYSADITATSGSKADIQAAVDMAQLGDTVIIPTGNWNFSGTVTLKERINVKGMGRDNTVLLKSDQNNAPMFELTASSGTAFKISDITLNGIGYQLFKTNPNSTILDTGLIIYGKATDFVIQNCRFTGFTNSGVKFEASPAALQGHPSGVISNNQFTDIYYHTPTFSLGYGVNVAGDEGWPTELQLGSSNKVFIEDNYFEHNRHCIAANYGGRYVFRNNTVIDNYYPFAAIDAHGKYVGTHGTRSYEIYDNIISGGIEWNDTPHGTWGIGLRGGNGVVFNNTFTGMWRAIYITIEYFYSLSSPTYPVDDQITDLWLWNNIHNGNIMTSLSLGWNDQMAIDLGPFLQEDRDYHFAVKPGYVAYTYPHPLLNLAGCWKLDEANGSTALDCSASGNNGTIYGDPVTITGKYGQALDLNGTSDYIDCGDTSLLEITGELTISAWVNAASGPILDQPQRTIASRYKWQPGGTGQGWFLGSGWNSNSLKFAIYNGSGIHGSVSYPDFFTSGEGLNVWKHIVGVFKPGEYTKLYIDGKCIATDNTDVPASIPYIANTSMMIGKRSDGNYFFDGGIDEIKIYTKALDESDINILYNLIADGSFELGLGEYKCWTIGNGTPIIDPTVKFDGLTAIKFDKPSSGTQESTIKLSSYIPVTGNRKYEITAWVKGDNIVAGSIGWHKYTAMGRWYDKDMVQITTTTADLNFPIGTYDWTKHSVIHTSPANAAYYRTTGIGLLRTSSGTGWIDKMSICPVPE
jgi:Concanavalin A-like lectin/glucanases superfamily/Right handed beta helix region